MQKARIKCPKCGTMMEVKNPTGAAEKTAECPGCGARLIVKFGAKEAEKTQYGSNSYNSMQGDDEEFGTNIMSGLANTSIGKLLHDGLTYPLQLGINTVGRKALTSQATIQIATENRSMSRLHSVIEVSRMFDGSVRTVIRNADNKNPTIVGGQVLVDGDRIVLGDGDLIKMGDVVVTFMKG